MKKMKAVVCNNYGTPDVLKLKDVEKPVPNKTEILIRTYASSVNAADCNTRGLTYIPTGLGILARLMLGFSKPRKSILGTVYAGEVVEIGKEVKSFEIGDRVFGTTAEFGVYAEFICRTEKGAIAKIPNNLNYEEAATIPYGALTAIYFLRDKANVRKGQKVLVKGASGGVGVFAIQIAKYFGATVTAVCSTSNLEFVKSLGADKVIDYKKDDFTKSDEKWDVIFDVVVGNTSFNRYKNSLTENGYYLAVAGGLNDMLQMLLTSTFSGKKVMFGGGTASEKKENLEFIAKLIEQGKIKTIIDKTFLLDEIVEAHRYVENGSKKGNIAISIN